MNKNDYFLDAVIDNDQSLTPGSNAHIGSQSFEAWFSKAALKA